MTDPKEPPADALTTDEERARAALVDDLSVVLFALRTRARATSEPDPARVRTILAGPLAVVARSTVDRLDDLRSRQRAEEGEVKP